MTSVKGQIKVTSLTLQCCKYIYNNISTYRSTLSVLPEELRMRLLRFAIRSPGIINQDNFFWFLTKETHHVNLNGLKSFLTHSGAKQLALSCPKIQTLSLGMCENLNKEGILVLADQCEHLTSLSLSYTRVSDSDIQALGSPKCKLKELDLSGCLITGTGLAAIATQLGQSLCSLNLSHCKQLQTEAIAEIVSRLPNLEDLNLSCCGSMVSEPVILQIQQHNLLQSLGLAVSKLNDTHLLTILNNCTQLKQLDISWCASILKTNDIKWLPITATQLSRLAIAGCKLKDEDLYTLLNPDKSKDFALTELDLSWCKYITNEGIVKALASMASQAGRTLTHLNLSSCKNIGLATAIKLEDEHPKMEVFYFADPDT